MQSNRIPELLNQPFDVSNEGKKDIECLIIIASDPTLSTAIREELESYLPGAETLSTEGFTQDKALVCGDSILGGNLSEG